MVGRFALIGGMLSVALLVGGLICVLIANATRDGDPVAITLLAAIALPVVGACAGGVIEALKNRVDDRQPQHKQDEAK